MEMNKDNVRTFGGKASGKKGFSQMILFQFQTLNQAFLMFI